jgi:3-oxoacyl-[acyl-carrier protein] reductase
MALLDNRVALITGAGSGIGRGIARYFAREGASLVIAEINAQSGAEVLAEVESLGARAVLQVTDVGRKDEVSAAVTAARTHFGGLDILVNNAFAPTPNVLLENKTDEMLARTLDTTLWAAWWAMRAAMPLMRERGGGRIINFYSIDAEVGAWLHADYNTAKSAILGLTRSAAAEWGRFNISVNAIAPTAPGATFWKLCEENPGFAEMSARMKPLGRVADPELDIAPVVAFLASDMSRYMTGELLHVDGGLHLPGYQSRPADLAALESKTSDKG